LQSAPVRGFRWYKERQFSFGLVLVGDRVRACGLCSRLELARILLADFVPTVALVAQPLQLSGFDGGRVVEGVTQHWNGRERSSCS
jgi:hypothetical protein